MNTIGGASGDMLIASLIDSGLSIDDLRSQLSLLDVGGFELSVVKDKRAGMVGTHLDVDLDDKGSEIRRISDFVNVVENSGISDCAKKTCIDIFTLIGRAEANVHGVSEHVVHLHELGTVDTLVDVVGTVVGLEMLQIGRVYCSPLPLGSGTVRTDHGLLAVPAPATAEIFRLTGTPVYPVGSSLPSTGEMVTPTGAAILGTIAEFSQPVFKIESTGCGLGTRNPDSYPNVITITTGTDGQAMAESKLTLIETNIDDSTGETLGYVFEQILSMGARDVWLTSIQMKKNRPGIQLSTLVDSELADAVIEYVLPETSPFGIRTRHINRVEAGRRIKEIECKYGVAKVKFKILDNKEISAYPEYEDCKKLAHENHVTLQEVYDAIKQEIYLVNSG